MAAWRRKALELFPQLKRQLNDPEEGICLFFFDLLPMAREAHAAENEALLRRVYAFAGWCFEQKVKELWNQAALCFYEHLFDPRDDWECVVPWLSPEVIRKCWPLWESRLGEEQTEELRRVIIRSEHAQQRTAGVASRFKKP